MEQAYLLVMTGQGDTFVKIVDQATWDYIGSPAPVFVNAGAMETPPGRKRKIQVTSGSYENDRALLVKGKEFGSVSGAMKYIAKKGLEFADEYHGCIY